MTVLYITYIDFDKLESGSSVRPQKIYDAFNNLGYKVILLYGSQGNDNRSIRKKNVKKISKWLDENSVDFCYVESPTYPILLKADYKLLKKISGLKIPIGFFYRDFYRKFPKLFPPRKGILNRIKESYLNYKQWQTDKLLKVVDIVYLPSEEAKYLFSFNKMKALPPAGENMISDIYKMNKTCIYVGGISGNYGFDILINAFKVLVNRDRKYRLILICRKEEWEKVNYKGIIYEWLEVYHVFGHELKEYYNRATVALLPKRRNEYNDFAVSVKLFEYMSFGLPVIAISNKATDHIIKEYNIGVTTEESYTDFAAAIENLLSDDKQYKFYRENVKKALLTNNLWTHRVETIANDLAHIDK